jgi:hypothetical protein
MTVRPAGSPISKKIFDRDALNRYLHTESAQLASTVVFRETATVLRIKPIAGHVGPWPACIWLCGSHQNRWKKLSMW